MQKKQGMPEEGEIVICTVTNVQYHSVFARMEEYGITGMIHISEVAAGRIRNINDYVKDGKVVVCKVLKIHEDRGHVDLSLRRVTEAQRRQKIEGQKRQKQAESIIEFAAKELKHDAKELKESVTKKLTDSYGSVFSAFEDVVEKGLTLADLGIDAKTAKVLEEVVRQRIKPKEVIIKGDLTVKSYAPDGLSTIKEALKAGQAQEGVEIRYLGGGKYKLTVTAKSYKIAEPRIKESLDTINKMVKDHGGEVDFKREGK